MTTPRREQPSAEKDALARLTSDVRVLLAKYEGRSKWVGFEPARREAWAEIERDLRAVVARPLPPGYSWCPPGCKSCTENRDCECYTHQDEPDRHAPLPPGTGAHR